MSDNSSSGAADPNAQRLATSEGSAPLRVVDLDDDSLSANQGRDSRNSSRASAVESDTARGGRPTLEQLLVTPVQDYLASVMGPLDGAASNAINDVAALIFQWVEDHMQYPSDQEAQRRMNATQQAARAEGPEVVRGEGDALYFSMMGRNRAEHYRDGGLNILLDRAKERTIATLREAFAQTLSLDNNPGHIGAELTSAAAAFFDGRCSDPAHDQLQQDLDEARDINQHFIRRDEASDELLAERDNDIRMRDEAIDDLRRRVVQLNDEVAEGAREQRSLLGERGALLESQQSLRQQLEKEKANSSVVTMTESERKRMKFQSEFLASVATLVNNTKRWTAQMHAYETMLISIDEQRMRDLSRYELDSDEYQKACDKIKKLQDNANGIKAAVVDAQRRYIRQAAGIGVEFSSKDGGEVALKLPKLTGKREVTNIEMTECILHYVERNPLTYYVIYPYIKRTLKDWDARFNSYWKYDTVDDVPDEIAEEFKVQAKLFWEKVKSAMQNSSLEQLWLAATSEYVHETNGSPTKVQEYDGVGLSHALASITSKDDRRTIESTDAGLKNAPGQFARLDPNVVVAAQRALLAMTKKLTGQCVMKTTVIKEIVDVLVKRDAGYQDLRLAWSEKLGQLKDVAYDDGLSKYGAFLAELEVATQDIQKGSSKEQQTKHWRANALKMCAAASSDGGDAETGNRAKGAYVKDNNAGNKGDRYTCDVAGCQEKTKFWSKYKDGSPKPKPKGDSPVLCDSHRRQGLSGTFAKLKNGKTWKYNRDGERPFPEYVQGGKGQAKAARQMEKKMKKMEKTIKSMKQKASAAKKLDVKATAEVQDRVNAMTTQEFGQWLSSQKSSVADSDE